jgi:hypothetical protein
MNIRKLGMGFNFPVKDTDSRQHGKGKICILHYGMAEVSIG